MKHRTEQELFWQGEFGDQYTDRNQGREQVASNVAFFGRALRRAHGVDSIIEFGPNLGMNLVALRQLLPAASLAGVEINDKAASLLRRNLPSADVRVQSILDFDPADRQWHLVCTKGVLIHMPPEKLPSLYDTLYRTSSAYILLAEYYDPRPVEVPYRGHTGRLFKRDFAGELMDRYADLELLDYGFVYHRDPVFPQDDLTWFLLRKQ